MRVTTKEKSIGIKYYANTALKSNNEGLYPLYVLVTYGYANTRFKAKPGYVPVFVSENLDQLAKPDLKKSIEKYTKKIQDIISKEVKLKREDFILSGLGDRIEWYAMTISQCFDEMQMKELISCFLYVDAGDISASEMKGIIDHARSVSVYDWMFETEESKEYLEECLVVKVKMSAEKVSKTFEIIELVINKS